ncbi:MAG: PEP-utilizing enzyme [Caldilineaceae bacterium]
MRQRGRRAGHRRRVLAQLTGAPQTVMLGRRPSSSPTRWGRWMAQFDPDLVLGVVTAVGGATGHAAILLRGLGIPTVMGVGGGGRGGDGRSSGWMAPRVLWPAPDAATQRELTQARQTWLAQRADQLAAAPRPPVPVTVCTCASPPTSAARPKPTSPCARGADEVGLFRSEFLFMARRAAG